MDKISNQSNNIDSIDTIQKTENKLIQKIDMITNQLNLAEEFSLGLQTVL